MVILQQALEGKYEVLEKIKEGGMGAVYKVCHRELDEVRVIKIIRPNLEPTPDLRDRFRHEAQVANRLRHPNIAMLHDFAVGDDGNAFIVMEYIDGLTLEDLLRLSGPPNLGLALEIGRQALRAIGYLHRHGYVHRDVAPDNLMLTRGVDGEPLVKLIDLGIAKVLEGEGGYTSTGMFLGKPKYASPEHFGTDARMSERSDLYSFGVVLYELLTGYCPIQGRDPASYMAGHLLRPVLDFADTDPEARIPSDLRWILLRTLAKKADERVESAEELARHLTAVQAQYPWHPEDLEHVLAAAQEAAALPAADVSSSIQHFLDRQFVAGATPAPTARIGLQTAEEMLHPLLPEKISPPEIAGRPARPAPPPPEPTRISAPPMPPPPPAAAVDLRAGRPPLAVELEDTVSLPGRAGPGRPGARGSWDTVSWEQATTPAAAERAGKPTPPQKPKPRATERTAPPPAPPPVEGAEEKRRAWIVPGLSVLFVVLALLGGIWLYAHPAQSGLDGPAAEAPPAAPPHAVATPAATTTVATAAPPATSGAAKPAVPAPVGKPAPPAGNKPAVPAAGVPGAAAPPAGAVVPPAGANPGAPAAEGTTAAPAAPSTMQRGDLIKPGPGVEYPEPDSIPGPAYPEAAKALGKAPTITLLVLVDENGKVIDARIKDGDSSKLGFNEAAKEAALKARFLPGKKDGIPGKMWTDLGIEFTLPP